MTLPALKNKSLSSGQSKPVDVELSLSAFASPDELWQRYCAWKGLAAQQLPAVEQDYHLPIPEKQPRYYQNVPMQINLVGQHFEVFGA